MPASFSKYPSNSLLAFEIAQQPEIWPTTLERVQSTAFASGAAQLPIILCGAGTSAYAAEAIAAAWPGARAIATTDLLIQSPNEIESAAPGLRAGGLIVSLARSGDSPESTAVVEKMQRLFPLAQHLAIVCNPDGRLSQLPEVRVVLLDPRSNDRSLAMTASFSNLALAGLALRHREELANHLPFVCDRFQGALPELNDLLAAVSGHCKDRIVILTSSMQALAKEIALKVVELTDGRVMAMPETFLGFRHGAVGFAREDTPVVCFLSTDPQKRRYERDVLDDLRTKGIGRLIIIGEEQSLVEQRDWFIPALAPGLRDSLRTPFEVPLGQLLAYHLSIHANVDPDNPSPNGTITRVVKPFRIHPETDAI